MTHCTTPTSDVLLSPTVLPCESCRVLSRLAAHEKFTRKKTGKKSWHGLSSIAHNVIGPKFELPSPLL